MNVIGWLGLGLLLFAYVLLSFDKTKKYFIPVDTIASLLLTIHAIRIGDVPFIIVNGFIAFILARQWYMKKYEV